MACIGNWDLYIYVSNLDLHYLNEMFTMKYFHTDSWYLYYRKTQIKYPNIHREMLELMGPKYAIDYKPVVCVVDFKEIIIE